MPNMENKVVVVTGAASGLGLADAKLLVELGAQVVMTDINQQAGEQYAQEMGATFVTHDVANENDWAKVMTVVSQTHGKLDGLVNNAGIAPIANIETTTVEVWRKTMAIHLDGTFFGCQAGIKLMKESGGGSIVNMSSTAALIGIPAYLAYSAAKGGIRSMSKAIAIHCRQEKLGIRCNSVHPGSISTPMVHEAMSKLMGVDMVNQDDPEALRTKMGVGEPNDVAHMVAYLLSDDAKHVNGTEMVIDNGDTVV